MTDFSRVFIDTSPFIYYLENSSVYVERMGKFFHKCIDKEIQIVTSAVTAEEYLVFPYINGRIDIIENFKCFIKYMNIEIISINWEIAEYAAELRSRFIYFKAMDALQIAAAVVSGCDLFLTNDRQLRQETELPCLTVDDL